MEDIIDIIVTETTNLIEITSQPTDEIIDVNIIDNREDVTLNVTPTVVEININSLTGNFGVNWGEIDGTLSNQTDLQNALNLKADLVGGKVPSSQLPSYVDDVVEVANYAALPATGETGKIYVTIDTNYIYRWTGSVYVEIKDSSAVWGAITGTLSNQTDLQNALNLKANDNAVVHLAGAETITGAKTFSSAVTAPNFILSGGTGNTGLYYGHTDRVVLANYTAGGIDFEVNGGSIVATLFPSGNYGLGITLDAGYKLDVNGTTRISGALSGTSASFSSSITASSIIKSGGTSSQFLKADGSVDSSTYATTSQLHNPVTIGTANGLSLSTQVLSLGLASSSANGALSSTDWSTFNAKISGSGTTNYVPKFTSASVLGNSNIQDSGSLITLGSNTYVNGSLGIGTSDLTAYNLRINKNITGATTSYSILTEGTIQSDVTNARMFNSKPATVDSTFTITNLSHYLAQQGTFGASSTVTSQYGFFVDTSLTGAANNYAFYSSLAAATGRWNLYMNGTANNYLAGALGIGSTSLTGYGLRLALPITGSISSVGFFNSGIIQSDVTSSTYYNRTSSSTAAASFTLTNIYHYGATQGTFGAGSTVTNQYGFLVNSSLTGATNNYGFAGQLAAATNTWNLYMSGTANNYIAGNLLIGSTTDNSFKLQVTGSASISAGLQVPTINQTYLGASKTSLYVDASRYAMQTISGYVIAFEPGGTEKMRITDTGNVGIGTTSPNGITTIIGNTVDIRNTSGGYGTGYALELATNATVPRIDFVDNAVYTGNIQSSGGLFIIKNSSNNAISFQTNGANERMRITSGGNVLINNTSDNSKGKLQVIGNTYTEGVYIETGSFSLGGASTGTFFTFGNSATNRVFLITVRQQGSGSNSVIGVCTTYSTGATAYNIGQDNTNPAIQLTLSTSGLGLRLTTGAGYGTTTWEYTITQIK